MMRLPPLGNEPPPLGWSRGGEELREAYPKLIAAIESRLHHDDPPGFILGDQEIIKLPMEYDAEACHEATAAGKD